MLLADVHVARPAAASGVAHGAGEPAGVLQAELEVPIRRTPAPRAITGHPLYCTGPPLRLHLLVPLVATLHRIREPLKCH